MKPLSRLAGLLAALLVTVVALSGTAHAMLPPGDPDSGPRAVYDAPPPPTVVVESGLSLVQVIGLMLLAAIAAAVAGAIVGRRMPRIATHLGTNVTNWVAEHYR
ncbi:hypothetical protein EV646_103399 [Kribbella antiqua]|uniref:Uncharacterized protein n=1 Tax=Kribbella antiqua TaxID=2512217 RepID=A0A4R2IV12_9ACTN|nr:hypothetical protein [Kribbella antiqua]TCO49421.1 hypothetical protein EV646_103399 [Kribbella antiqua]